MAIENSIHTILSGDFRHGYTSLDARLDFDDIAEKAARLREILKSNPRGLAGAAYSEATALVSMIGMMADSTAGDRADDMGPAWGIVISAQGASGDQDAQH